MKYRIGLDLGTNSIGWAILRLDDNQPPAPVGLVRLGSRIFSDGRNPKDGSSLATERRGPRQMRRRRDRYLYRRKRLMAALVQAGLMPNEETARKELVSLNPYELRARGLSQRLEPHELGRVIFHLNQRRGFKSNRKTDKVADDSGKIKSAIATFKATFGSSETVGAALFQRMNDGKGVRARLKGAGAKATYDFYVERSMIEDEFNLLIERQIGFSPNFLKLESVEDLRKILFSQRPLRPVKPGKCFLDPKETRIAEALPSAQLFRLYQEVNHLRVIAKADRSERALSRNERDTVIELLSNRAEMKFEGIRKHLFGGNRDAFCFTLESEKRKALTGNIVADRLSNLKAMGAQWKSMSVDSQDELAQLLIDEEDENTLAQTIREKYDVSGEAAQFIATKVTLPDGHLRLGATAVGKVLRQFMESWDTERDAPLTYDKAVRAAGYSHHAHEYDGEILDQLPYYGERLWRYTADAPTAKNPDELKFGKIGNPTVHIALNQTRKLINAIIKKYGHPAEVHVELARELKIGRERNKEIIAKQTEQQHENDSIRADLRSFNPPIKVNAENRLRLRLYRELSPLNRQCVYSGRSIELTKLFTNEYQIDHILPFSRTLDDSTGNKLLVHQSANRFKGNRTPFESFAHSPAGYEWDAIVARAKLMNHGRKYKRFEERAMQDWQRDEADFLARQLTDTAYLARVSREYLTAICPPNRIVCSPGRLTALLRGKWGLNDRNSGIKNREDSRHHAIDACIIAATDRSLLQSVSTTAARARDQNLDRLFGDFPIPWEGFREAVVKSIERCVVSYKPDHGAEGGLHNETAYGVLEFDQSKGSYRVYHRVRTSSLGAKTDVDSLQCADDIKTLLRQCLSSQPTAKALEGAIQSLVDQNRLPRKVKIIEAMTEPILIKDRYAPAGTSAYKAYKGDSNYCYEVFLNERGKQDGKIITTFVANQKAFVRFRADLNRFRQKTFEGRSLIMRLMRDDLIGIEEPGQPRRIMRVARISEGMIALAEHFESNVDKRNRDTSSGFRYLYKSPGKLATVKARRVFVDLLGHVLDPGFPA